MCSFFYIILHAISVRFSLLKNWCSFFLYDFTAKVASSFSGYVDGKLLNCEKTPGKQVVSIVLSTKEGENQNQMEWKTWQQENVTVKKQSNVITLDELINIAREEMNEGGKFIYTI